MLLLEICSAFVQNPTVEITSKNIYYTPCLTMLDSQRLI
jgi:hypothetical protein